MPIDVLTNLLLTLIIAARLATWRWKDHCHQLDIAGLVLLSAWLACLSGLVPGVVQEGLGTRVVNIALAVFLLWETTHRVLDHSNDWQGRHADPIRESVLRLYRQRRQEV